MFCDVQLPSGSRPEALDRSSEVPNRNAFEIFIRLVMSRIPNSCTESTSPSFS